MKIKTVTVAILTFVIIFGTIGITAALGLWQTETTKIPAKISEGDLAGSYDPADIRGSYDLATVSEYFDIPIEDLALAFHVPMDPNPSAFLLKDLEAMWAESSIDGFIIETGSVRLFVAAYQGITIPIEEGTGLPKAAVEILLAKGKPTEEQKTYILAHQVAAPANSSTETDSTTIAADEKTDLASEQTTGTESVVHDESESEYTVKGATTWKEVEDWGVPKAEIEKIFGSEIALMSSIIRDDCTAAGVAFSTVKAELQTLVDALHP